VVAAKASMMSRAKARATCRQASGRSCSSGISFVERGLDAQGAHEDVRKHGAISHGLDGVAICSERAAQVGRLLDFSEQQLDEPSQSIGLNDLASGKLAARHGGQVPADCAQRVCDADEPESDRVLALAPNDIEVEDRASAVGNGAEVITQRPVGN
jgi:hypothetical protein